MTGLLTEHDAFVIHAAIHTPPTPTVRLSTGVTPYNIACTRTGIRKVDVGEFTFIAQNPDKKNSTFADRARRGEKITWIMHPAHSGGRIENDSQGRAVLAQRSAVIKQPGSAATAAAGPSASAPASVPSHSAAASGPAAMAEAELEDGFALRPVLDAGTRSSLQMLLETSREGLGKGRDAGRGGRYDRLVIARAWHIENDPDKYDSYERSRQKVERQVEKIRKAASPHAHATRTGRPPKTADAASRLLTSSPLLPVEQLLLHGTQPEHLLDILANGLNERYAGDNAGAAFGQGIYLAEDAGKCDQARAPAAPHNLLTHARMPCS